MRQATLTQPEYLVVLSAGPILTVAYDRKHAFCKDLSLIHLLLIFSIWMCHIDSVVCLGVESNNQGFV